jgi:hypothetical protein
MADEQLKAFDADGNRILIPATKEAATELTEKGGHVASDKEIKAAQLQDAYAAKSTGEQVGGALAAGLAGPVAGSALAGTGAIAVSPEYQAAAQGAASAATGGLDQVAVMKALEATAGKGAARAYAQHQLDVAEANPEYKTGGELAGFAALAGVGSGAGAARAVPGLGISALGGAAEGGIARLLGGVAARGVAGRAVTSAASLGARGAVEGALYGAANQFTEDQLGDKDVAADRLFAATGTGALWGGLGGVALGGGGSLAKSAASGAVDALGGGISRMTRGAEDAAARTEAAASRVEDAASRAEAAVAKSESKGLGDLVAGASNKEAQLGVAYDQAWKSVGGGYGLQSTRFAKQAAKYLPNGTKDVGEAALRYGVIDSSDGAINAMRNGTPEAMVPKIETALDGVGARLGEITDNSGARIPATRIIDAVESTASPYAKKAGFGHVETGVRNYGADLVDKLGVQSVDGTVSVQDLLYQRKALDQLIYKEAKSLDPGGRVQALRDLRGKLEDVITSSLDEASGKVKGELAAEYKSLKKDYTALSIMQEAAADSAARSAKGGTLSLTDKIIGGAGSTVGAVIGGPLGALIAGPGASFASKLVRERGNAAAAVLLYRMAESGTITRAVNAVDNQLGLSARGLLAGDRKALPAGKTPDPVARAREAESKLAEIASDPERTVNRVANLTQPMAANAPNVAGGVARGMTRAIAFLQSKLPPQKSVDPLAPNRARAWTSTDAEKFMRYVDAAKNPMGVLADIERGKVTSEGVETLKVLVPTLYRDLQQRTMEEIADQLAKGKPIPYETRLKLGTVLDIPADPSLRPQVKTFLQSNVTTPPASGGKTGTGPTGPAHPPIKLATQHSEFDRLSETGRSR